MMRKDPEDTYKKMKIFYKSGYMSLYEHHQIDPIVEGFFFSDCGV